MQHKSYTIKQLKKVISNIPDDFKLPQEWSRKYNTNYIPDPITGEANPGGRAWIMWFIDQLK